MSVLTGTPGEGQEVDRGQYLAPLLGLMMIMIDGYDLQSIGYVARSEERRVGKECRSRWSPYH